VAAGLMIAQGVGFGTRLREPAAAPADR